MISATTQSGGFSPGSAARLTTADGMRAFVKAVGMELNEGSVDLHRREATAMAALPGISNAPALIGEYDADGWVALLLEDVPGRKPALPWVQTELDRVLDAVARVSAQLTPSPWPNAPAAEDVLARAFVHWRALAERPPADLDPRWLARIDEFAAIEPQIAEVGRGGSVIHLSIRSDNVLLRSDGEAVLVDWAWACCGAPWLDVVILLLNVGLYGPHTPAELDAIIETHPLTRDVDPWSITLIILGSTGILEARGRDGPPPGLPTIRNWQRYAALGAGRWLGHRLGIG